jgi:glycerol-3-phosphate dehydrogenase
MKVSRGAHIVLPKKFWPGDTALLIPKTDDGRVVFLLPWRGSVLVGTTDDADKLSENPMIYDEEKTYLLEYFNRYAIEKARPSDIKAGFVGLRPLLQVQLQAAMQADTKSLVRDHEVEVDRRSKLVSIMGGKWTTYRIMAEDTLDILEREVLHVAKSACLTKNHPIMGGGNFDLDAFLNSNFQTLEIRQHLYETYGSMVPKVIEFCLNVLHGTDLLLAGLPYLQGEIEYLKKHEMATCWSDVLDRRWGIGLRDEEMAEKIRKTKKEAFASIS